MTNRQGVDSLRRGHPGKTTSIRCRDSGVDCLPGLDLINKTSRVGDSSSNTVEKRLLNGRGLPAFNLRLFVLNAKGDHAGVAMYASGETTYAVCDDRGSRSLPLEGLLSGSPTD